MNKVNGVHVLFCNGKELKIDKIEGYTEVGQFVNVVTEEGMISINLENINFISFYK